MINKFIFLTCCLITGHVAAYENELIEKMSQNVDRYEMKVVMDKGRNTQIFLLDKEKGIIWVSTKSGYYDVYCPWVQLPSLSVQESE